MSERVVSTENWSALFRSASPLKRLEEMLAGRVSFLNTDNYMGWTFFADIDDHERDDYPVSLNASDIAITLGYGDRHVRDIILPEAVFLNAAQNFVHGRISPAFVVSEDKQ